MRVDLQAVEGARWRHDAERPLAAMREQFGGHQMKTAEGS